MCLVTHMSWQVAHWWHKLFMHMELFVLQLSNAILRPIKSCNICIWDLVPGLTRWLLCKLVFLGGFGWFWYILVLTLTQVWTVALLTVSNKRIGTDLRSEWHRELMSILWSWGYSMVSTWGYVLGLSLPLRVKILPKSSAAGEENGKGTGWVDWTQTGLWTAISRGIAIHMLWELISYSQLFC